MTICNSGDRFNSGESLTIFTKYLRSAVFYSDWFNKIDLFSDSWSYSHESINHGEDSLLRPILSPYRYYAAGMLINSVKEHADTLYWA